MGHVEGRRQEFYFAVRTGCAKTVKNGADIRSELSADAGNVGFGVNGDCQETSR